MNPLIKEFASVNLIVIWLIVFGGFAFLSFVKRQWED